MKIIRVDGYARETVADRLVVENINSIAEANIMLQALLNYGSGDESIYYKLVEDDYKLWGGMEELV